MSVKNSYTTADPIEWDTMLSWIHRLYRDGDYIMSLFIGCGSFFGLRVSDLRLLTWGQLLSPDRVFAIREIKTGKRREIRINANFQRHIRDCFDAMGLDESYHGRYVFVSQKDTVYCPQSLNKLLKKSKEKYRIKVEHLSTHSLRKTFGRKVVENAGAQSEMALIKLCEIFNHTSPAVTRRYLGLRQQELGEVYEGLDF